MKPEQPPHQAGNRIVAAGIAFVAAVLGIAFWANSRPRPPPPEVTADVPPGFDTFCGRAGLVAQAIRDCQAMMAKATTDEERLKVERLFAMGGVKLDTPAGTP